MCSRSHSEKVRKLGLKPRQLPTSIIMASRVGGGGRGYGGINGNGKNTMKKIMLNK